MRGITRKLRPAQTRPDAAARHWPLVVLALAIVLVAGCATTNWTTYHRSNDRAGVAISSALVPTSAAWSSPQLDGAIYGEPLVFAHRVIVATENDSLYALDLTDGHIVWGPTHVGTPVPKSWLQCGDIFPLGITSTPVVDPATNTLYAVAERTTVFTNIVSHDLVAVDAATGAVRWQHPIDPAAIAPIDRRNHQQRAALALANGRVYVAFGGLAGDCGNYTGWLLSARTDGTGTSPLESYKVPTAREGAIWGASGPAIDATGDVYVTTGNGASSDPTDYDHGNSIVKLAPNLVELDHFAPTTWAADSAVDADLGSTGPTLLANSLIFQAGKNGTAYLVDATHLGGIGGQKYAAPLCRDFGGNAYHQRGRLRRVYGWRARGEDRTVGVERVVLGPVALDRRGRDADHRRQRGVGVEQQLRRLDPLRLERGDRRDGCHARGRRDGSLQHTDGREQPPAHRHDESGARLQGSR